MEESDSGQQPKRCPCGFWGSPQTSGLCSKCYKAVVQEKTQDTLDAKSELMRERQSAYTSHDSIGATSSSYIATSCSQSSASDVEKAGELLRQAVRNSNNTNQSVELTNKIKATANAETSNNTGSSNPSEDSEKSASSSASSTSKTAATASVAVGTETCENSVVDSSSVASKTSSQQKEAEPDPGSTGSCPSTPDKRGLKRDSSALEEDTPDSTPEKPGTKSKKRCAVCKCKLELAQRTIGRCRCDNVYCSLHRLPELHNCDFDHKEDGRREAREKMVKPTRHLGTSFKRLGSDS